MYQIQIYFLWLYDDKMFKKKTVFMTVSTAKIGLLKKTGTEKLQPLQNVYLSFQRTSIDLKTD